MKPLSEMGKYGDATCRCGGIVDPPWVFVFARVFRQRTGRDVQNGVGKIETTTNWQA